MKQLFVIFFFGALAGTSGTAIGCLIGKLIVLFGKKYPNLQKNIDKSTVYSMLFEFSSGLMMAIVTFHLLPEAIGVGGVFYAFLGLISGLLFLLAVGRFLHQKRTRFPTGFFLFLGILIHNIPEGMALGTAFVNHLSLAVSLLIVITIHDIPEGISAFLSYRAGDRKPSVFQILLCCGISTALAAVWGYLSGGISSEQNAVSLGFAAGAMLYILVFELSSEAKKLSSQRICEAMYIVGLILGILLK